jgi:hypothetical protein
MDAFEHLRGLVLADGDLQEQLRGRTDWDDLAAAALAIAARAGFSITRDDLVAARRAARRSWIERDVPPAARAQLDDVVPHGWTPVRFSPDAVEWGDLRGVTLHDPFFLETVQRAFWEPYRLLFRPRTSLAALEAVAARIGPARPAGLVLHTSRCGSTLVCRMLGAVPGTLALSEPVPCDEALRAAGASEATRARWLRWLLAALGADGAVVKLDAWSIRERGVLREALPGVPWIFLYRDPAEVLASQAHMPGMIMVPGMLPPELFELDHATAFSMAREEYAARVLGSVCDSALRHLDDDCRLISYADLPDAVMTEIAPHFGLATGEVELALMREAATADAKRPFESFDAATAASSRPVSGAVRAAASRWAGPAVAELERRRLAS